MRAILSPFTCVLFLTLSLIAQNADKTPVPRPTPDNSQVVKITTSLIQIDAMVRDQKGRPVADLKPEEFELYENGVRQTITGFFYISNPQPAPRPEKKVRPGELPIPEPPVNLRREQIKRTVALVVDDLSLSFESSAYTRRALKKFVDEQMQDGDLVAIIRTGAGIGALQQFTSNKLQLYAAIERVRWNSSGLGRFGSFDPIEPTGQELMRRAGDPEEKADDLKAERDFNKSGADFRESVFTTGTLGALKYIVDSMGELPGRKSVLMFSDGFNILNESEGGSFGASRTLEFLKNLVGDANRKAVIFYPLDARGLEVTGFSAADSLFDPNTQADTVQVSLGQRLNDRSKELFNSQQGLQYLAKETGGFAYINRNDLSAGVQKALEDQSYYLIAYEPNEETFDPSKRKYDRIEIKVKRPGLSVRHRSGFFVGEEEKRLLVDLNVPTKIMKALTSPFAQNGIAVSLNALFGYEPKRGYYIHSFLHIDASGLDFKPLPNGDLQANFDVLAISYGDNGMPVEKNNATGSTIVKLQNLERVRRDGISYSFIFPVKKPGAYQMRVAILDRGSREVGSANQFVEVPDLKKEGMTLSGIVLENMSKAYWGILSGGNSQVPVAAGTDEMPDPKFSTARRRFRRGTVLRYGVEIYNARSASIAASQVRFQTRVFHDRQLVFQSKEGTFDPASKEPAYSDAFELGGDLVPGDYVLQIVVIDGLAKNKRRLATQYIQFEVVE